MIRTCHFCNARSSRRAGGVYFFSVTRVRAKVWHASMFLRNIGVTPLVVSTGIFLLSFSKWYVVGNAAISSIGLGILLSHIERDTDWHRGDASRPIKLDVSRSNVLLSPLDDISRVPTRIRSNAKPSSERQCENTQDFHLPR